MKVDVSTIEGYEDMTAEEKVAALEGVEINVPEPDYSGYVKKETFDKTASELAAKKKELSAKLTEDEQAKQAEAEKMKQLQEDYEKLLKESQLSKNKAHWLGLGYDEKLAEDTAQAMLDGDMKTVFANQKKFMDAFEKKIKAEVLKDTPKPHKDDEPGAMTLEKLRKMSATERADYALKNPEEYKELYKAKG